MLFSIKNLFVSFLLYVVLSSAIITEAQESQSQRNKRFEMVRAASEIIIDGKIDEVAWKSAPVIDDFLVSTPNQFDQPSEYTQVYVLYDQDALYIGARLWDSQAENITAQILRQGESIRFDDDFAIILDPFNNQRSGYFFAVNPNGVRDDAVFQNTTAMEFNWDGIWRTATTRDEQGWVVEVELPMKTLSFDSDNETWGINFERHISRIGERVLWVTRNRAVNPSVTGAAIGLRDLEQGKGLDIVPSLSINHKKEFSKTLKKTAYEPSLDLFYKVTPSLNASLTINTDFSATDVDDRQVNLTRFNLFFPEKRDFFLRDTDIFQFGRIGGAGGPLDSSNNTAISGASSQSGRPFFSRKIGLSNAGQPVDIDYGGKLSGRIGRWNIGALSIQQGQEGSIEQTNITAIRGAANILSESAIGFFASSGDPTSNKKNQVLGVDAQFVNTRLSGGRILRADAWYLQADTEGTENNEDAYGFRLGMPNPDGWRGEVGFKEIQENYRPALGFVDRRGIRDRNATIGYRHRFTTGPLESIYGGIDTQRIDLINGGLQSQQVKFRLAELSSRLEDRFIVQYRVDKEVLARPFEISKGVIIPKNTYSFGQYGFGFMSTARRKASGAIFYRSGDFYGGKLKRLNGNFAYNFNGHFRTKISFTFHDISLPEGNFTTRLISWRNDLIFSPKWSWVNLIQYDNVSEVIGINSRVEWIPKAGREAYLVINHNVEDFDLDNRFHSYRSDIAIKFNYTFRF